MNKVIVLMLVIILVGCSKASTIRKVDESESGFDGAIISGDKVIISDGPSNSVRYRIFHQGASGFVPMTAIRNSAKRRARVFCDSKNKTMRILEEESATIFSGWPSWPRVEYIFICLESGN